MTGSAEEIERAIMSAVDFSRSPEDVLWVASYLAANGFDQRAIQLFQDVAATQNFRPEPYIHGLAAAQRLNDIEGLRWACEGILSHAWPREHHAIERKAKRVAMATLKQLREDGQQEQASQYESVLHPVRLGSLPFPGTGSGGVQDEFMTSINWYYDHSDTA